MVIFPLDNSFQMPRKNFEISEAWNFGDGIIDLVQKISGISKFYSREQEFWGNPKILLANALGKYVHI